MADRKSIATVSIRLRKSLHEKLVSAARANDTSLNKEIVGRLERPIDQTDWRDLWQRAIKNRILTAEWGWHDR